MHGINRLSALSPKKKSWRWDSFSFFSSDFLSFSLYFEAACRAAQAHFKLAMELIEDDFKHLILLPPLPQAGITGVTTTPSLVSAEDRTQGLI